MKERKFKRLKEGDFELAKVVMHKVIEDHKRFIELNEREGEYEKN